MSPLSILTLNFLFRHSVFLFVRNTILSFKVFYLFNVISKNDRTTFLSKPSRINFHFSSLFNNCRLTFRTWPSFERKRRREVEARALFSRRSYISCRLIHGRVRPQKFALKVYRVPQEFIEVPHTNALNEIKTVLNRTYDKGHISRRAWNLRKRSRNFSAIRTLRLSTIEPFVSRYVYAHVSKLIRTIAILIAEDSRIISR